MHLYSKTYTHVNADHKETYQYKVIKKIGDKKVLMYHDGTESVFQNINVLFVSSIRKTSPVSINIHVKIQNWLDRTFHNEKTNRFIFGWR